MILGIMMSLCGLEQMKSYQTTPHCGYQESQVLGPLTVSLRMQKMISCMTLHVMTVIFIYVRIHVLFLDSQGWEDKDVSSSRKINPSSRSGLMLKLHVKDMVLMCILPHWIHSRWVHPLMEQSVWFHSSASVSEWRNADLAKLDKQQVDAVMTDEYMSGGFIVSLSLIKPSVFISCRRFMHFYLR